MDLTEAFKAFQASVNAEEQQVMKAQERRDFVRDGFADEPGMKERFPSGSLARGTMLDPINDVDYVVVYEHDAYPEWGSLGHRRSGHSIT